MQKNQQWQAGVATALIVVGVVVAAIVLGAVYFGVRSGQFSPEDAMEKKDDAMMEKEGDVMEKKDGDVMENKDDTMMEKGTTGTTAAGAVLAGTTSPLLDFTAADYEKYAASDKLVVLYFYANWCPICRVETRDALYPAFNELAGDDVIGFRVNFNDNETDEVERGLAKEFGVAYQHTKVFLKNGERVLKSPESWDKARYATEISRAK